MVVLWKIVEVNHGIVDSIDYGFTMSGGMENNLNLFPFLLFFIKCTLTNLIIVLFKEENKFFFYVLENRN